MESTHVYYLVVMKQLAHVKKKSFGKRNKTHDKIVSWKWKIKADQ